MFEKINMWIIYIIFDVLSSATLNICAQSNPMNRSVDVA